MNKHFTEVIGVKTIQREAISVKATRVGVSNDVKVTIDFSNFAKLTQGLCLPDNSVVRACIVGRVVPGMFEYEIKTFGKLIEGINSGDQKNSQYSFLVPNVGVMNVLRLRIIIGHPDIANDNNHNVLVSNYGIIPTVHVDIEDSNQKDESAPMGSYIVWQYVTPSDIDGFPYRHVFSSDYPLILYSDKNWREKGRDANIVVPDTFRIFALMALASDGDATGRYWSALKRHVASLAGYDDWSSLMESGQPLEEVMKASCAYEASIREKIRERIAG